MRTIPALACDVEEMFHAHKVTGINASIRVRPRLETKTLCCQALLHILVVTCLNLLPTHSGTLFLHHLLSSGEEGSKNASLYGVSYIKTCGPLFLDWNFENAPPPPPSISNHLSATTEEPKSRRDWFAGRNTPSRQDHRSSSPQWLSRNAIPACPGR